MNPKIPEFLVEYVSFMDKVIKSRTTETARSRILCNKITKITGKQRNNITKKTGKYSNVII